MAGVFGMVVELVVAGVGREVSGSRSRSRGAGPGLRKFTSVSVGDRGKDA